METMVWVIASIPPQVLLDYLQEWPETERLPGEAKEADQERR
jgi:hypothetical protein